MKVYLAGPINGCADDEAHGWRDGIKAQLPGVTFLDPMARDYRGREDEGYADIVNGDIEDIDGCDYVVANCWQASWGTAMEIHYAASENRPVVAVVPEGHRVSPWLRYHAWRIVPSLEQAAVLLAALNEGGK